MTLTLGLLLLDAVLQIGLGLWIGRRLRTGGDFFVAGRGLSTGSPRWSGLLPALRWR